MYPLRKATAKSILSRLTETWCRYGFPKALITDNASYFSAKLFKESCEALGIQHRRMSPWQPQGNATERCNRDIKPLLGAFVETHKDWDNSLNELAFALRTRVNRSTGFTPAYLNLGRELCSPLDYVVQKGSGNTTSSQEKSAYAEYATQLRERMARALDLARQHRHKARLSQKSQYDKLHRDFEFEVGDTVMRRNHVLSDATKCFAAALAPKWIGPYVIHEKLSRLTYKLKDQKSGRVSGPVHIAQLKAYKARDVETEKDDENEGIISSNPGFARSKAGSRRKSKRRLVDLTSGRYNLRPRKQ